MNKTPIYTIAGNNPLKFFGEASSDEINHYKEEDLFRFFYSNHPEVSNASFNDVKLFFKNLGAEIQQFS
jgi:hypothetical protein